MPTIDLCEPIMGVGTQGPQKELERRNSWENSKIEVMEEKIWDLEDGTKTLDMQENS